MPFQNTEQGEGEEVMQSKSDGKRPLLYLFAMLLAVVLASGIVLYTSGPDSVIAGKISGATAKAFAGGTFEASGVAHVPGTSSILFIDDGRPNEVLWMELDEGGNQRGAIKAVSLGVSVEDPEGITTDGTYFYIVSSQSRPRGGGQAGLVRFKFNPANQTIEDAQTVGDLKQLLVANVSDLRDLGAAKAKDDGINIEALAWDPAQGRLLLGLRSPVIDGNALVVPLKLSDARGQFSLQSTRPGGIEAIRLALGGQGIRSMEYDEKSKLFQIIAGATEAQDKNDFKLWEWGGDGGQAGLRDVATFDRKMKPEGVTRASVGNSDFKFVVFDTSKYLKMP
jgi:hypothetical protein